MRLLLAVLLPAAAWAQVTSTCDIPFETDFQPGRDLRLRVRSGEVRVVGVDLARIRVTCHVEEHAERARDIAIRFHKGELEIKGGPTNNVAIRVEVPVRTNLWMRVPAGEVTVKNVTGDKDVAIHAGELTIAVGSPLDYQQAGGSVRIGDLRASPFGVEKSGFFRSFKKRLPGRHLLRASVGVGELSLR